MMVLLIINTKANSASQEMLTEPTYLCLPIHIIYHTKTHNGLNSRSLSNGERGQRVEKGSNNKSLLVN
jgi:hypothetical protein